MVIITLPTTVHLSKAVTDFSNRKEKLKKPGWGKRDLLESTKKCIIFEKKEL